MNDLLSLWQWTREKSRMSVNSQENIFVLSKKGGKKEIQRCQPTSNSTKITEIGAGSHKCFLKNSPGPGLQIGSQCSHTSYHSFIVALYLYSTILVCLCRFADRKKQREEAEETTTSSTYQRRAWDSWDTTESPLTLSKSGQVVTVPSVHFKLSLDLSESCWGAIKLWH